MATVVPDFSSPGWLRAHHVVKEASRRRLIGHLTVNGQSRVLDLGCGPGLWFPYFVDHLDLTGCLVGLDRTIESLREARTKEELNDNVNVFVVVGDALHLPFISNQFDIVLCTNVVEQVSEPRFLIREALRVLRPDGRIVLREFDGATILYHPLDPSLQARIQLVLAQSASESRLGLNYLGGRTLPGLVQQAGFAVEERTSEGTLLVSPLTRDELRFVSGIAQWQLTASIGSISAEDVKRWTSAFEPSDPDCILDTEDFAFHVSDFTVVGRKLPADANPVGAQASTKRKHLVATREGEHTS